MLKARDFEGGLRQIRLLAPRATINALLPLFYHHDEEVRWRAITAAGVLVEILAAHDKEGARIIMRRLMWSLNDESGGIGWGAPEAMGEIMARDETLAREYAQILVSYMDPSGNFLEHEGLQRGLLWGLGRLAEVQPALLHNARPHIPRYLNSRDPVLRGLAARLAGLLTAEELRPTLLGLLSDDAELSFYSQNMVLRRRVKEMALEALAELDRRNEAAQRLEQ